MLGGAGGRPEAHNLELLCLKNGPLWNMVAYYFCFLFGLGEVEGGDRLLSILLITTHPGGIKRSGHSCNPL